ncbi:MAG: ribosome small subunit-dependent GTPase A [Gammaproteobacteria bacterium]|nr:ribosome small subunit-dependent GTPase A [Gammaproteobacteria bacterium]
MLDELSCAAKVVFVNAHHVWIQTPDRELHLCQVLPKINKLMVGDLVEVSLGNNLVTKLLPRTNMLIRSDRHKSKKLAANVDQVMLVIAPLPRFSEQWLMDTLIACQAHRTTAIILVNKADLEVIFSPLWERLQVYRKLGYTMMKVSLVEAGIPLIEDCIKGKTTLLLGRSGVGKSSLIKKLVPNSSAVIQELSKNSLKGKNTTSGSYLYRVDENSFVIDSPGFELFGLDHLSTLALTQSMPDISQYASQCRFNNCLHRSEPDCAIKVALKKGDIDPIRLQRYLQLYQDSIQRRRMP